MSSLFEEKSDESGRPREECGLFAIYGHEDAARITFFGLFALQHRGQESAGIVSSDGCNVSEHKGMGLVSEVFKEERINYFTNIFKTKNQLSFVFILIFLQ